MSQTIDDRIVKLEFENQGFEQGVSQSLTTLQKLKNSLQLDGAAKNLTALSNAASKFNLNGISEAVDQVGEKFSYMKYAGLVAISNLVTGAMQAGKRISSALLGPITTGGWNRAMNLEQANFMMKGLLKNEEAVAAVMDNVSESVDGTAYSLDAAAKVAAQFSASGVKAGEGMLSSLKAVAGTAAMTNSSFEEIGSIFTTVAGQGKLMAYQMNQLSFRGLNAAATLGEQLGKSEAEIRDMVSKGQISFQMFSDAMNAAFGEHAKEANNTFQGALSNVKSALGRIGAEFATPFIRNIIPVLNSFRLAINATKKTLTPFFETSSSVMEMMSKRISAVLDRYTEFVTKHGNTIKSIFQDLINTAKNVIGFISQVLRPIREAFDSTFEGKTLAYFKKIAVMIFNLSSGLNVTGEAADKLKHIFRGFFSIFDTIYFVIRRVVSQFDNFIPTISHLSRYLTDGLTKISSALLNINQKVKNSEFLNSDFLKVPDKLKDILSDIPNIGDHIRDAFDNIRSTIRQTFEKGLIDTGKFNSNMDSIKNFFQNLLTTIGNIFKKLGDIFQGFLNGTTNIADAIVRIIEGLINAIARAIQGFLNSQNLKDLMAFAKSSVFISILNEIKNFIKRSKGLQLDKVFGATGNFNFKLIDLSGLTTLANTLKEFKKNFVDIEMIKALGTALLQLSAALLIISTIEPESLKRSVLAISAIVGELGVLVTGMSALSAKLGADGLSVFAKLADTLKKITTAILMLSISVTLLSFIDIDKLIASVAAIGVLCAMLVVMSNRFSLAIGKILEAAGKYNKLAPKIITRFAKVLMNFAKSLLILSVALKILSTIPLSNMIDALIALTVVLGEMALFMKMYQKIGITEESSKSLISLGAALVILSLSLKLLSTISLNDMGTALLGIAGGLGSMVAVLAILAAVMKAYNFGLSESDLDFNKLSQSILILSLSLIPLSAALKILSTIGIDEMGNSLIGLAGGLGAMVAAMTLLAVIQKVNNPTGMGDDIDFNKLAASLLLLSVALIPLAGALKLISTIPYDKMAGTMINFAVGLGAMVGSLYVLSSISAGKLFAAAGALDLLSVAVLALSFSLVLIKNIEPMDIVYSLGALAAAIGVLALMFGVIGAAASYVALGALALLAIFAAFAGGIALVGLSIKVLGAGFTELGLGLGALALGFSTLTNTMAEASKHLTAISAVAFTVLGIFAAFTVSFALLTPFILIATIGIAALAGGLTLLGLAADVVGKGIESVGHGFDALGIGIASMAVGLRELMNLLVDSSKNLKDISKSAFTMLGIFAAFAVTIGILSPFLIVASIGIAALAGGLALVGLAMNVIGTGLVVIGTGFTAMQTGLDNLAKGLQSFLLFLTQLPKDMGAAAKGAFIFLGVLAAFAVALTIITPFLLVGAVGVLAFGAALVVLGAGMYVVGAGLTLMSNGLILFGQAMENIRPIAEAILGVMIYVWEGIKAKVLDFVEWFKNVDWAAVGEKILTVLAHILIKIGQLLGKAKDWLAEKIPQLWEFIKEKVSQAWDTIKEFLHTKWEELKTAISSKWEEFKNEIGNWKDQLVEKGKYIIQGLIDGINKKIDDLKAIPGKIREKIVGGIEGIFQIESPSKVTYWDGLMIMMGLNEGMEEGMSDTESTVDSLGNILEGGIGGVVDGLKDKVKSFFNLDISKANKEIEGSISDMTMKLSEGNLSMGEWNDTAGKSWDRVKELTDELNRLQGEYDAGRMSLEEYKAATGPLETEIYSLIGSFEDLQSALAAIDDELRLAQNENSKYMDMVRQGTMQQSVAFEITKKNTKAIHDLNEIKYNLTGTTKTNTDATNKEKDALDANTTSTNTNTKSKKSAAEANKELGESLKSTLESQMDIFKKFEAKNPMNKSELLANMQSQIKGMTDWAGQMNKLATMGIDQGLYKKLAEMGPQGAEYVGAFTQMTAEELAQANQLWAQSLTLPGDVAGMIANDFNNIGLNVDKGLAGGIAGAAGEVHDATTKMVQENTTDPAKEVLMVESPSQVFKDIGFNVDMGLALGMQENANIPYNVIEMICKQIVLIAKRELNPENFKTIGGSVIQGVAQGIEENLSILETATLKMTSLIETVAKSKKGADINSPSKKMIPIGEAIGEGVAVGIDKSGRMVSSSVENLSDEAINSMKYTIASISAAINNEMEDPVIRPVLDLSNVQAGARSLNSIFSTNQSIKSGSVLPNLQNGQYSGTGNVIFNQNNYSPKALSRIDIYRDTKNIMSQYKQSMA